MKKLLLFVLLCTLTAWAGPTKTFIPIRYADPQAVLSLLPQNLGSVKEDGLRSGLVVRGDAAQIERVKQTVGMVDVPSRPLEVDVRILTLARSEARPLPYNLTYSHSSVSMLHSLDLPGPSVPETPSPDFCFTCLDPLSMELARELWCRPDLDSRIALNTGAALLVDVDDEGATARCKARDEAVPMRRRRPAIEVALLPRVTNDGQVMLQGTLAYWRLNAAGHVIAHRETWSARVTNGHSELVWLPGGVLSDTVTLGGEPRPAFGRTIKRLMAHSDYLVFELTPRWVGEAAP